MSLRDQLLAKGLVSKKRARNLDREAKQERKADQGSRKRLKELEREARERADAEAAAERERLLADRQAREAAKEAADRALRIRNLIAGNRLRPGRGQRFWHRSADGSRAIETSLSSGMAFQLRCGEAGLAALDHGNRTEYVLLPARAAEKLFEIAPELLVFWAPDASGLADPSLAFHERDWEVELGPRRATEADLERFRLSASGSSPRRP